MCAANTLALLILGAGTAIQFCSICFVEEWFRWPKLNGTETLSLWQACLDGRCVNISTFLKDTSLSYAQILTIQRLLVISLICACLATTTLLFHNCLPVYRSCSIRWLVSVLAIFASMLAFIGLTIFQIEVKGAYRKSKLGLGIVLMHFPVMMYLLSVAMVHARTEQAQQPAVTEGIAMEDSLYNTEENESSYLLQRQQNSYIKMKIGTFSKSRYI
ncbi:hypothetical protein ACJMK2_004490 [Sinanodonta woodiana]|uniref:Claudin n=1 Tax=Sinanodonta woodiana TaxID=1069815 RepID=A0ABD3Y3F4_SINWO